MSLETILQKYDPMYEVSEKNEPKACFTRKKGWKGTRLGPCFQLSVKEDCQSP